MAPRPDAAENWEHLLAETKWLGRLAAQLVPPADRDDLVHDVLVAAAQHAQKPRSVRAWLTSVARNLAARRWLRAHNRRTREAAVARAHSETVPVADAVASFATHRAVVNAVMALEEPYRAAVLLRFWDDLPVREVAKRTGVPAETARTRIKRGVERLRGSLDREAGDRRAWTVPLLQIRAVHDAMVGGPTPLAAIPFLAGALMSKGVVVAAAAAVSVLFAAWVIVAEATSGPPGEGAGPRGGAASLAEPFARVPDAPSAPADRREVAATGARPGVHVDGHVVALDGSAVPRARIHALGSDPSADPVLLATAGDDGAFALRDVEPETRLQARAAGWQPSNGKTRVAARRGDTIPIRIVMGARGHALAGRVVDDQGAGAARALVAIAVDEECSKHLDGVVAANRPPGNGKLDRDAILVRADEQGHFATDEVPQGEVVVLARGTGVLANVVGTAAARVIQNAQNDVVVRLQRGAEVYGEVRDEHGKPHGGLRLTAVHDGSTAAGEFGRDRDEPGRAVTDRTAVSAADGTYCIRGLFDADHRVGVDATLARTAQVALTPGERRRLDFTVERTWQVPVRVQDESGGPLADWVVIAGHEGTGNKTAPTKARTGADGVCLVTGLQSDRVVISVHAPDPERGKPVLFPSFVRTVARGAREVTAVVAIPAAALSGRVLRADGAPAKEAEVALTLLGPDRVPFARFSISGDRLEARAGDDGAFVFGRLPAGEFRLQIREKGLRIARDALLQGQEVDLGAIVMPPAAPLEVEVRGAQGRVWVTLLGAAESAPPEAIPSWSREIAEARWEEISSKQAVDGKWRTARAAQGRYVLQVRGDGIASTARSVDLIASAPQRVVVECHRGVEQEFVLEFGDSVRVTDGQKIPRPHLLIEDTDGLPVAGFTLDRELPDPKRRVVAVKAQLLPATYRVRARIETVSCDATVTIAEGGGPALRLVLRE